MHVLPKHPAGLRYNARIYCSMLMNRQGCELDTPNIKSRNSLYLPWEQWIRCYIIQVFQWLYRCVSWIKKSVLIVCSEALQVKCNEEANCDQHCVLRECA